MGTRGLTCVVQNGEFKIAQYGQWDHYPDGQGGDILAFLEDRRGSFECFRDKVSKLRSLTLDEVNAIWDAGGPEREFISRDAGAKILSQVADGACKAVYLSQNFANDSLFCEWAYVIDLDENKFEVYEGFQKSPHNEGRFAGEANEDGYYPVRLRATFDLFDLPTREEFLEAFRSDDED